MYPTGINAYVIRIGDNYVFQTIKIKINGIYCTMCNSKIDLT